MLAGEVTCTAMRALTVFFLALLPLLPAQEAPTGSLAKPTGGTRILGGGGKLPKAIYERFLELAGGTDGRIVLIPTASGSCDTEEGLSAVRKRWTDDHPGYHFEVLHTRDRARADDEAFCAPLRTATAVWLGGGTQKRLADAYLGTRVEKELLALLARGGVVGGTSAGTAIQTRTMIQEGKENPIVATGFDFVPGAISDQHFLKRERLPRLLKVLAAHPGHFGIGVDEGTAVETDGAGFATVRGASKALFVLAAMNGHEQIVREVAPDARDVGAQDLGEWRSAAQERASWSIAQPGAPRLGAGALLLGHGSAVAERFVALAGGRNAKIVVFDASDEEVRRHQDDLRAAGATDVRAFTIDARHDNVRDCEAALTTATGVVFGDGHLWESEWMLAARRAMPSSEAVAGVLTRGGVVWGNGVVGEVVARSWPLNDTTTPPFGYRRGLGLLPGTMIVTRRLQRTPPGEAPGGPITDGAPHLWVYRCAERLPRITGIHVESGALIRGDTLEALGELPTYVLPATTPGKPGDAREKVTLEPGTKWDLATGKKL